ncbi:DUF11 domain-containing protein [Candidatus Entotheonella palauensis]|uniref:DUF11 domain-containing protein n=1 Tax=Candidatus Entotheonella palauensis TaxID=93172 RepID=UPI0015C4E464|nr:DUF11 domain-containing protein [Candidatus Entotheonella palauensis]
MAAVGQTFQYSYVIKNQGSIAVNNIEATDTLPTGVSYVSLPDRATSPKPNTITWDVGSLLSKGDQSEGSFVVRAEDRLLPGGSAYGGLCKVNEAWVQGRSVTNTLRAAGDWTKSNVQTGKVRNLEKCNTCIQPGPPPALLLEVVDLYDTVETGDTSIYRITVTNQDAKTVKNINVAAWLPEDFGKAQFSGPKVRRLQSVEDLEPYKDPIKVRSKGYVPEDMLVQVLREKVRAMLWAILRNELAQVRRRPEALPQASLHRRLEGKLLEAQGKLRQELMPQNGYPPLSLPADKAYDHVQAKIIELMRSMLREMLRDKEQYPTKEPVDLNTLTYLPVSRLLSIFEEILPIEPPLPTPIASDQLKAKLEMQWPLDKWPLDDVSTMTPGWIRFDTIPELRQYWRATYYVEAEAQHPAGIQFKVRDVRFKVIMTADEFSGPVIETESTHLVNSPIKP